MPEFAPPSPPYLGPAAHTSSGSNMPVRRIVIHSTVSPCVPGQARNTATYFRSQSAGGSAHYVVDPAEVVQVVGDSVIAWHAPPNANSLGIELCDMPTTADAKRWADKNHAAMLNLAARLVAELCLAYDVPPYYVGILRLKAGARGVTTHNNVSKAFGQSTHWDPGAWPRRAFMRAVRAEVKAIKAGD
jgi:N-acetylmuramoyl-L-alanine amidase CwlA